MNKDDKMKIICYGDSQTRGVSYRIGRLRILKENYPNTLQKLLSSHHRKATVINKGVFNDNSDLLLQRLSRDVIAEKPDYTIIGVGGNDCDFQWDEVAEQPEKEHQPTVPLERYLKNIKEIVQTLQESAITPIVLTLPPLDPIRYYELLTKKYDQAISHWISKVGGIEYWHGLYNYHLNQLIDQLHVAKIDVRNALKKVGPLSRFISGDGIHLTAEGYAQMGTIVYQHMKTKM